MRCRPPADKAFDIILRDHRLSYHPGGSSLVVRFDNAARPFEGNFRTREAWGKKFYVEEGHSLLGVIARTPDWFRCKRLISEMEALVQSGFFKQFRSVFLVGASMGAFAACAFSRIVPDCIVLAISPQSTADPEVLPWERRFHRAIKQDWSLPYGSAIDGLHSARRIHLVYDPLDKWDSRHIRRFPVQDNIVRLKIPGGAHDVIALLIGLGKFKECIRSAMKDELTVGVFHAMVSKRKDVLRYRMVLARHAIFWGHYKVAMKIVDSAKQDFPNSDLSALRAIAYVGNGNVREDMRHVFPNDPDFRAAPKDSSSAVTTLALRLVAALAFRLRGFLSPSLRSPLATATRCRSASKLMP